MMIKPQEFMQINASAAKDKRMHKSLMFTILPSPSKKKSTVN